MPNECKYDAAFILGEFKSSLNYLFFNKLHDQTITTVIESLLRCPDVEAFYRQCPRIFCCWIVEEIAICLASFQIKDTGTSEEQGYKVIVPDINDSPFVSYVKKDVVRDESREFFKPEFQSPCEDCGDFPLGKIKDRAKYYFDICKRSRSMLGGVGTDYGCKTLGGGCLKDDYKE